MLRADDPRITLLTAKEAAAAAHVPDGTVRTWIRRKLLLQIRTDEGLRYVEDQVLDVEAATRDSRRAARLAAEALEQLAELDRPAPAPRPGILTFDG